MKNVTIPTIPSLDHQPVYGEEAISWACRRITVVRFALQHFVTEDGAIAGRDLHDVPYGLADLLEDAHEVLYKMGDSGEQAGTPDASESVSEVMERIDRTGREAMAAIAVTMENALRQAERQTPQAVER